jgi:hypothetical protein
VTLCSLSTDRTRPGTSRPVLGLLLPAPTFNSDQFSTPAPKTIERLQFLHILHHHAFRESRLFHCAICTRFSSRSMSSLGENTPTRGVHKCDQLRIPVSFPTQATAFGIWLDTIRDPIIVIELSTPGRQFTNPLPPNAGPLAACFYNSLSQRKVGETSRRTPVFLTC